MFKRKKLENKIKKVENDIAMLQLQLKRMACDHKNSKIAPALPSYCGSELWSEYCKDCDSYLRGFTSYTEVLKAELKKAKEEVKEKSKLLNEQLKSKKE